MWVPLPSSRTQHDFGLCAEPPVKDPACSDAAMVGSASLHPFEGFPLVFRVPQSQAGWRGQPSCGHQAWMLSWGLHSRISGGNSSGTKACFIEPYEVGNSESDHCDFVGQERALHLCDLHLLSACLRVKSARLSRMDEKQLGLGELPSAPWVLCDLENNELGSLTDLGSVLTCSAPAQLCQRSTL